MGKVLISTLVLNRVVILCGEAQELEIHEQKCRCFSVARFGVLNAERNLLHLTEFLHSG